MFYLFVRSFLDNSVIFFAMFYDFGKFPIIEIAIVIGFGAVEHFIAFIFCEPGSLQEKQLSDYCKLLT